MTGRLSKSVMNTHKIADWCNDSTFIRTARKQHKCLGGWARGIGRVTCTRPIEKGERYVEYLGETPMWQSGQRYHLEPCAEQHQFVEKVLNETQQPVV